jgi:hypothetical protein
LISLNTIYTKNNNIFLLISIFFTVYMYVYSDIYIGTIYFIYSTFILSFLYVIFKYINSIFIKVISIYWYIGYVLSIPIIYGDVHNYSISGWGAVGSFDFSYEHLSLILFQTSIYFIYFLISSLIVDRLFSYKYYFQKITIYKNTPFKLNPLLILIFVCLIIVQFPLSSFMFENKIGVVGLIPERLPFRLSGALYYYRLFIFPIITTILVYATINKKYSLFIVLFIILEAIYSGIMGLSKFILIIHMLPVIYYFYIKQNKSMLVVSFITIIFFYTAISFSRNYIYPLDVLHSINLSNIILFLLNEESLTWLNNISFSVFSIIKRLGGMEQFIPTYFNTAQIDFVDYSYFLEKSLGMSTLFQNNFDVAKIIYGLQFNEKYAFGIGSDSFSHFYFSSKTFLDLFVVIFTFTFIGVMMEFFLKIIFVNLINENQFIVFSHILIISSILNYQIKFLYFQFIPILLIMYLFISVIIFKKYKYKWRY